MSKRILLLAAAATFAFAAGSALAADQVRGPFWGAVHAVGNGTGKDGNAIGATWDRGKITSLSDTSITLTRRDGVQVGFTITSGTTVRNGGATYQLSDLQTGLAATVLSQNGDAVVIRRIRGDGAPSGGEASRFEGPVAAAVTGTLDVLYRDGSRQQFEFDRGRLQSVDDGTLTVLRPDGKTVTLSFDSSTIVREPGGQPGSTDELQPGMAGRFFSQDGVLRLVRRLHQAPLRHHRLRPAASSAAATA